ncbi:MAG: DUF721 domain-containing protein [Endomicrobium sp.]|jgi:hypothetical protein|nr:DUF721 domain-containing protein [Endomicrobium sp.]
MPFTEVSKIIGVIKKDLGLDEDFFVVAKVWEKELGIEGIEISGYKNGIIYAETSSTAAINEIMIRKKEILKKLNQYLSGKKLKNIKMKIK